MAEQGRGVRRLATDKTTAVFRRIERGREVISLPPGWRGVEGKRVLGGKVLRLTASLSQTRLRSCLAALRMTAVVDPAPSCQKRCQAAAPQSGTNAARRSPSTSREAARRSPSTFRALAPGGRQLPPERLPGGRQLPPGPVPPGGRQLPPEQASSIVLNTCCRKNFHSIFRVGAAVRVVVCHRPRRSRSTHGSNRA